MPAKLKILLVALSFLCAAVLVTAFAYQRHLRFLMTDYSSTPPATVVAFPPPGFKPLTDLITIDGLRLPFSESEILKVQTFRKIPFDTFLLQSGIEMSIHAPEKDAFRQEYLDQIVATDLISRASFRWSMTSVEVEELHNQIIADGLTKVSHVGIRKEPKWTAVLQMFPSMDTNQVQWMTLDEKWTGVLQFNFRNAPDYAADLEKQIEFMSQLALERAPTGNFGKELKSLLDRIRAKDPSAIIDEATNK